MSRVYTLVGIVAKVKTFLILGMVIELKLFFHFVGGRESCLLLLFSNFIGFKVDKGDNN